MASKYPFPYSTVDSAIQDNFRKIGGKSDAMKVLAAGWYQVMNRKTRNMEGAATIEYVKKNHPEIIEQVRKQEASTKTK